MARRVGPSCGRLRVRLRPGYSPWGSSAGLRSLRLIGGTALHAVEIVGAAVLLAGYIAGLYIAAISMIVLLAYMISGAWLLIMGVSEQPSRRPDAP